MRISYNGEMFLCHCSYDTRHFPKQAGFRWDPNNRKWYTQAPNIAAQLREYADESAKKEINRLTLCIQPWLGGLSWPKDLVPLEFQKKAALFALERNHSYIGIDPGGGKTIVAALVANALKIPIIYVCPPFMVLNVMAEFEKWAPEVFLYVIPDSIIHKKEVQDELCTFAYKNSEPAGNALLIIDEAHRFKTKTAKRTKAVFSIAKEFNRVMAMSGTPMPNRPIELYPVLSNLAPEVIDFKSEFQYASKYCAAYLNGFGWDYSGAANMKELSERVIGKFMLRLKKADILPELPPKTEELLFIGDRLPAHVSEMDQELLEEECPEDLMKGILSTGNKELHLATYRRELGLAKVEPALEYINALLEESDESILIFAYHKEVIEQLREGLKGWMPLVITGDTHMPARHEIVKKFQTSKTHRVFIGNYLAAGTGLTLTKATRVIFVEFSWVSTENDQAGDRAHRIGQRDNVYCQFLVYRNSIDRKVIEVNWNKRRVTNHI